MRAQGRVPLAAGLSVAVLLAIVPPRDSGAGSTFTGPPEAFGPRIDSLAREGALTLRRVQPDFDFPEHRHLRYDQRISGVRVFGRQVVQQVDSSGRTLTVFGHFEEGLRIDVNPSLTADQAVRAAEGGYPAGARAVSEPELVVLTREGAPVLTWMLHVRFDQHLDRVFIDAHDGHLAWQYDDLRTAAAVGVGTGVWGDQKKVSTDSSSDGFRARDQLRPPVVETYDLRFDTGLLTQLLRTHSFNAANLARTTDNTWHDGAVVDAHAYAGWTYDYYYKVHGRRGIDGNNLPIHNVTHFFPRSFNYSNAFWDPVLDAMFYGDGDGFYGPFSGALDVVAHELTHGVTQYTWDGIYAAESGALNEAFSDIMGAAVEFFFEPEGSGRHHSDYWLGEDLPYTFDPPHTATRSMENPGIFCYADTGCDPDNYSIRYRGQVDGGGVHVNSGIANQAFYLLVEGGVNRTSGIAVSGLGAARREDAEKIFYRGFTLYLTPSAGFRDARAATIQAATDLFGPTEAATVAAVWTAVGVE